MGETERRRQKYAFVNKTVQGPIKLKSIWSLIPPPNFSSMEKSEMLLPGQKCVPTYYGHLTPPTNRKRINVPINRFVTNSVERRHVWIKPNNCITRKRRTPKPQQQKNTAFVG